MMKTDVNSNNDISLDYTSFKTEKDLVQYLKDNGVETNQRFRYIKEFRAFQASIKVKPLTEWQIRNYLIQFIDEYKITRDINNHFYFKKVKQTMNCDTFRAFIDEKLTEYGENFSDSMLERAVNSRIKILDVIDPESEHLQSVLDGELETCPNGAESWTQYFLEHFGFPSDKLTCRRLCDFFKRQFLRVFETAKGLKNGDVNSMLCVEGEGGLGKDWMWSMFNKAAFGGEGTNLQKLDEFTVYYAMQEPFFSVIQERVKNADGDDLKQLITSKTPMGRGLHQKNNIDALVRTSFILTTNDIGTTFKFLETTKDTGLKRRFIILKSTLTLDETREALMWDDDYMIKVCENVIRESYKSNLLDVRKEVHKYNDSDFNQFIAKDNFVKRRIHAALKAILDEFDRNVIRCSNITFKERLFKLYIYRGSCPRDVPESERINYPEYADTTRCRLIEQEVSDIFDHEQYLTLYEIANKVNFDIYTYCSPKVSQYEEDLLF